MMSDKSCADKQSCLECRFEGGFNADRCPNCGQHLHNIALPAKCTYCLVYDGGKLIEKRNFQPRPEEVKR